jgi:hypothetical protein
MDSIEKLADEGVCQHKRSQGGRVPAADELRFFYQKFTFPVSTSPRTTILVAM